MDTDYLRSATRTEHEATEATLPLMDSMLTKEQYVAALQGMLRAIEAWDAWTAISCPPRLKPLLEGRRRSGLLRADLAYLGEALAAPVPSEDAPWLPAISSDPDEFEAMFLGAMYVVEGSTLGGQYIARHVEEILDLPPGRGDAYFRGYGEHTGAMWKEFKATLAEVPDRYTDLVVSSAKRMFSFFAGRVTDGLSQSVD